MKDNETEISIWLATQEITNRILDVKYELLPHKDTISQNFQELVIKRTIWSFKLFKLSMEAQTYIVEH